MDRKNIKIIILAAGVLFAVLAVIAAVKFYESTGILMLIALLLVVALAGLIVKWPVLGALAIVATLPFERLLTVDIGGMTIKPVHVAIAAAALGWLVCILSGRIKKIYAPVPVAIAILFFMASWWSYGVSLDPERTEMVLLFFLIAIVGFFLVIQFVQTVNDQKKVLSVLMIATGLLAFFGFYQIFGDLAGLSTTLTGLKAGYDKTTFGLPRVHATLPEPLYYGCYLLTPMFLSAGYFLYGGIKDSVSKKWMLIICLSILINLILTFSRGAYFGLAISGVIFLIWQRKKFFKVENIAIISSVLVLGAMLIGAIFALSDSKALTEVYEHLSLSKKDSESVVSRESATEIAYDGWLGSPWRGIGLGAYGYLELYHLNELSLLDSYHPIVNNQYVETLAETGAVGAACFLLLIIIIFWRSVTAWRLAEDGFERASLAGLTLGVLGILAQYVAFSTIYIVFIWAFMGLLVATQEIIFRKNKNVG